MRALLVASWALALSGCSGLQVGMSKAGVTLEASAAAVAEAERSAVADVLDLYISTSVRASASARLDGTILARPRVYIKKSKVLKPVPSVKGEIQPPVRIRALVKTGALLKDLNAMGLVRPEGVYGTPKLLVSLRETGFGAGKDVGRASDVLRRQLSARGYAVEDLSDRLSRASQRPGSVEEVLSAAKAAGADIAVAGTARAQPVTDERLRGYRNFRGRVDAAALWTVSGATLAAVTAEASAVDLLAESSAVKALENAGQLAAEMLAQEFTGIFRERSELWLLVTGLDGLERLRRFVADLRGLPGVAGAALVTAERRQARLRVFVEKLTPDDLGALLMRLPGYSFEVRSVESDYNQLEVEDVGEGDAAPPAVPSEPANEKMER